MKSNRIAVDPILLTYVAQALGRVPENLYDFQKIKNLACGGRPVYQKLIDPLHDPVLERLEIIRGDFSVIGKMSRLKKLAISAMQVNDFSFLQTCTALESLEISACGVIDCALLKNLKNLKSLSLLRCPKLLHIEDILELFCLTMLSLEGSMVSDAGCFIDCGIKEVHLPEHCLKARQSKKKAVSKAKKAVHSPVREWPFRQPDGKLGNNPYSLQEFDSILWESYENAILQIRDMTIDFLAGHMDYVWEKDTNWRRGFAFAVTAILGEKKLAFMLTMSELESCYIICPACENCDEEIEFGYFDPSKRIEKAKVPTKKWDGENLADINSWLFNLFALLGDAEGMERLRYYFGTYICPKCGERTAVLTGMAGYFLS